MTKETDAGGGKGTAVLPGPKRPFWACGCGTDGNWASRVSCRSCGRAAPKRVKQAAEQAAASQGQGRAQKPTPKANARPNSPWNGIEALAKQVQALQKVVQQKDRLLAATAGAVAAPEEAVPMEADGDEGKAALRREWEVAKAKSLHLRATPAVLRESGFDEELLQAESRAKAAEDLFRAHGTSERQRSAYLLREDQRAAKAAEAAKLVAQDKHAAVLRLEQELVKAKEAATVADSEVAKACVAAEAAGEARKAHAAQLATRPDTPPHDPAQPPEGFVSVQFAIAEWEKREMQFREREAYIQGQLQQMVAAAQNPESQPASAAPSEAAASDLGDVIELDDDPHWKTVAQGKRKALLAKSSGLLATRLQKSLGTVGKVSSPFKK